MGQIGKLDTDTNALAMRIKAHAAFGTRSLEDWAFSQLNIEPGQNIIELGCGTGKQTIPLARLIGEKGHITAVDIAESSLTILKEEAASEGLTDRITLINCRLDEIEKYAGGNTEVYDRAAACYSIYYANDPEKIFHEIHKSLKKNGRFFFCGPASTNNSELKEFHHSLHNVSDTAAEKSSVVQTGNNIKSGAAPFMEETGQALAEKLFSEMIVTTFENPLIFSSADALYDYWKSYNLYDPNLDSAFKASAGQYFQKNKTFTTNKRVLGVLAIK